MASLASSVVSVAQWSVVLCALGGQSALQFAAGTPLVPLIANIQENKMASAGGAWFVGSSLAASMVKTGAFEVVVRDDEGPITVWSGIQRGGRPPNSMQEMSSIVEALRTAGVGRASPQEVDDLAPDL
jgi:hypothetical protein